MGAWYRQTLSEFKDNTGESIVERLSTASAERNLEPNRESVQAWRHTVDVMS